MWSGRMPRSFLVPPAGILCMEKFWVFCSLVSRVISVWIGARYLCYWLMLITLQPQGHKLKNSKTTCVEVAIYCIYSCFPVTTCWSQYDLYAQYTMLYKPGKILQVFTHWFMLWSSPWCKENCLNCRWINQSQLLQSQSLNTAASLSSSAGNNTTGDYSKGIWWPGLGGKWSRQTHER